GGRLEGVGDAGGLGHVPPELREHVPDVTGGAVPVVGRDLDQERHAPRAVAFVLGLFVGRAFDLSGAAIDRAIDVRGRHVDRAGRVDRGAQPRVGLGIPPAVAGGAGGLLGALREQLAARLGGGGLLTLDRRRLGWA